MLQVWKATVEGVEVVCMSTMGIAGDLTNLQYLRSDTICIAILTILYAL
jgi:hypothetical protein